MCSVQRSKGPIPDVAELGALAVILQSERCFRRMRRILVNFSVRRRADQLRVVLNDDPVVNDGNVRWFVEFVALEPRSTLNDVVRLPLTGLTTGIDERWVLAVDRTRVPVGVRRIIVVVEHLNFVPIQGEDAAVSLPCPLPSITAGVSHSRWSRQSPSSSVVRRSPDPGFTSV